MCLDAWVAHQQPPTRPWLRIDAACVDLAPMQADVLRAVARHGLHLCAVPLCWQPAHLRVGYPSLVAAYPALEATSVTPYRHTFAQVTLRACEQEFAGAHVSFAAHADASAGEESRAPSSERAVELRLLAGDTSEVLFKDLESPYFTPPYAGATSPVACSDVPRAVHAQLQCPPAEQAETDGPQQVFDVWSLAITSHAAHGDAAPYALSATAQAQVDLMRTHSACDLNAGCRLQRGAHDAAIPSATVYHPLNMGLLLAHPRNLTAVLPHLSSTLAQGREHKRQRKDEVHDNFNFPGLCSPSWYLKGTDAFFYAHVEQYGAYFTNYAHRGSMRWYCVQRAQLPLVAAVVLQALLDAAAPGEGVSTDELQAMREAAAAGRAPDVAIDVARMLVLGKRTFPSLRKLLAAGQQAPPRCTWRC